MAQKVEAGTLKPLIPLEDIFSLAVVSMDGIVRDLILTHCYNMPAEVPGLSLDEMKLTNTLARSLLLMLGVDPKELTTMIIERRIRKMRRSSARTTRIVVLIISAIGLIGIFVPILVNYILDGRLTWSWYSLGAIVMAWWILIPIIVASKYKAVFGLLALSLTLLPFLYLMYSLVPYESWFENLAWPLVRIILPALWVVVLFVQLVKASRKVKGAFALIVLAILMVGIDYAVGDFLNRPVNQAMLLLKPAVAGGGALLLLIAQLLQHSRRAET